MIVLRAAVAIGRQSAVILRPLPGNNNAIAGHRFFTGIGSNGLKLGNRQLIPVASGLLQPILKTQLFILAGVDHLADAHIGMEQIRALEGGLDSNDGPPAVRHQNQLFLFIAPGNKLGDFNCILDIAVYLNGVRNGFRVSFKVSPARSALIVVDNGEILLDRALKLPCARHCRRCRAAMYEQNHRIAPVLAPRVNPLPDAANLLGKGFLNTIRRNNTLQILDTLTRLLTKLIDRALVPPGSNPPQAGKDNKQKNKNGLIRPHLDSMQGHSHSGFSKVQSWRIMESPQKSKPNACAGICGCNCKRKTWRGSAAT